MGVTRRGRRPLGGTPTHTDLSLTSGPATVNTINFRRAVFDVNWSERAESLLFLTHNFSTPVIVPMHRYLFVPYSSFSALPNPRISVRRLFAALSA